MNQHTRVRNSLNDRLIEGRIVQEFIQFLEPALDRIGSSHTPTGRSSPAAMASRTKTEGHIGHVRWHLWWTWTRIDGRPL